MTITRRQMLNHLKARTKPVRMAQGGFADAEMGAMVSGSMPTADPDYVAMLRATGPAYEPPTLRGAPSPTVFEILARLMMGDGRASPERRAFTQGFLGTTGIGDPGIGVADFSLVPSLVNAGQLAQRSADQGDALGTALGATAGMIPGARPVARGALTAARGAAAEARAARAAAAAQSASDGGEGALSQAGRKAARSARKPRGARQVSTPPPGVETPQAEAAARRRYMKDMEAGAEYRHWYDDAGQSNLFHMGDDPLAAARFTAAEAITSSSTPVNANLGHSIRAHNQRMAGDPAKAGLFPNNMGERIDRAYDASDPAAVFASIGPKIGPYGENIAVGGGYAPGMMPPAAAAAPGPIGIGHNSRPMGVMIDEMPKEKAFREGLEGENLMRRPVNDIWQARGWGYQGRDGKVFDRTPTLGEHNWMDEQTDRVIAAANQQRLAGVGDWDHRSAQAAAWIGNKARHEGTSVADAGRSYAEYWPRYYGQGSWETTPGRTTDLLPGLADAPFDTRQKFFDAVYPIMVDPQGRDRLSLAFGLPTGRTVRGPGVYEGGTNPGAQSQVALGRATGGNEIDPSSAALMNAVESTRGLLLGQDAVAWHLTGNMGEAIKRTQALDFNLGQTLSNSQMSDLIKRTEAAFGKNWADLATPVPTANGVRMLFFGDYGLEREAAEEARRGFVSAGREIGRRLGFGAPERSAMIGGNLIKNNWRENPVGQLYLQHIDRPVFKAAFDRAAPQMAASLNEVATLTARELGAPATSQLQRLRRVIADDGYQGLMRAIRTGALSIGAVGLMLEMMPEIEGSEALDY